MTKEEREFLERNIPRFIDKPRLIGIFEMDEFFLIFGTIGSTFALSLAFPGINSMYVMLISIVLAVFLAYLYKKFKKGTSDGYTFQKLYRAGIISPNENLKVHVLIKYPYLKRISRVLPYGFTKVFYN